MKFKLLLLVIISMIILGSCAVLSESQQKRIKEMTVMGGDVLRAPSLIVENLAEVREQRGLFYVSSIKTEGLHIQELDAIFKAQEDDSKLAKNFDAGLKFLNSYLFALRSMANENRWKDYGTEIRAIGRTVSSSLEELNEIGWVEEDLPAELVKASSYSLAGLTGSIVRRRQMAILRDYIKCGDTLVNVTIDSMVVILKSKQLQELIENEQEGLNDNYKVFLKALPLGNITLSYDRMYLEAVQDLAGAEKMRRACISGLQAFKRAHNKMVVEVGKRKDVKEVYQEFVALAEQSAKLGVLIQKEIKK